MIIRFKKGTENPYVMIRKEMFEDPKLSLKAKGLLGNILCKPDNWKIYIAEFASRLKENRATIGKIMQELVDNDYCVRTEIRGEDGRFEGYDYTIYEVKNGKTIFSEENHRDQELTTDRDQKTVTVKPATDNCALLINEETKEREEKEYISKSVKTTQNPENSAPQNDYEKIESAFIDIYKTRTDGLEPTMNYGKNRRILKPLLKTHSVEDLLENLRLAAEDAYINDNNIFDISVIFSSNFTNKYDQQRKGGGKIRTIDDTYEKELNWNNEPIKVKEKEKLKTNSPQMDTLKDDLSKVVSTDDYNAFWEKHELYIKKHAHEVTPIICAKERELELIPAAHAI